MGARVRTVESVEEHRHGGADCWHVVTRAADGHGVTHLFPKETLEWRAAEFGIDPDDVDTLLDLVLHEAFIDDAADGPPVAVMAARSTAEARQAQADRIDAVVKAARETIIFDRAKTSPLDVIRQRPGTSVAGFRAKREMADVGRWRRLYGGLPVEPDSKEASRA
ncbi:hypothetical protein ABZX40_13625 [Streptomyces sp. NPDC004610]|uniref:hypothetical protein n=1 Tax=unclassified Streptomyces TaxID=2593676 RepID=UPI0033B9374F